MDEYSTRCYDMYKLGRTQRGTRLLTPIRLRNGTRSDRKLMRGKLLRTCQARNVSLGMGGGGIIQAQQWP